MENIKELEISQIAVSELNPRKSMNDKNMIELVESVKQQGILQPILVMPDKGVNALPGRYWIICGERRFWAAQEAGLKKIPCIIKDITTQEAYQIALVENLQRENMNPMQEAISFDNACKNWGLQDLADKIGKSISYIINRIKLLTLHAKIQQAIMEEKITVGHGIVLARLADQKEQKELFDRIINEKLSVASAENELGRFFRIIKAAQFDTKDCVKCPSNGSTQKDFFDNETNLKGQCMDRFCFVSKTQKYLKEKAGELKTEGYKVLDTKQMKKEYGENSLYGYTNNTIDEDDHKSNKYKTKCLKCEKHVFYMDQNKDHSENDRIKEICMNPRCYNASDKKEVDTKEQEANKVEQAKRKAEDRAKDLYIHSVKLFINKEKDAHLIKAITCMEIWGSVMGEKPDDSQDLKDLIEKTDKELQDLIDKAITTMIKDQYGIHDLVSMAYYTKFDLKKNLDLLDSTFWNRCSKQELLDHAKELKIKDLTNSDKNEHIIGAILETIKPGFIPKEVARFLKESIRND